MRVTVWFLSISVAVLVTAAGASRVALAETGGWVRDAATGCAAWSSDPSPAMHLTWSGTCVDGKADGEGTLQWFHGAQPRGRYQGEYRSGRRHGEGIWWAANGDLYDGDWKNDQAEGRGVLRFADGGRYEGDFRSFRFHGQGVWRGPNGERYEGGFADGEFEGHGTLTYTDGGSYSGEFLAGEFQGMGELRIASGEVFAGPFVQSRPHCVGRCGLATGESGSCEFLEGSFQNWIE